MASVTNAAEFTDSGRGYKLSYPDRWQVADAGGTFIEIMSPGFRAVQTRGRVAGAAIGLMAFPPPMFRPERTNEESLREWANGRPIINQTAASSGHPATVTYAENGSKERSMVLIRRIDTRTFFVWLDWFVHDSRAQGYKKVLTQVADSISLIPIVLPTPLPTPSWRDLHECSCEPLRCEDGGSDPGCSASCSEGTRATCMCGWCKYDSVDKIEELISYSGCECEPEEGTPTPGSGVTPETR